MNTKKIYLGLSLLLGCALMAPLHPFGSNAAAAPGNRQSCGSVLPAGSLVTGAQLDLSAVLPGASTVFLLDAQGNVLASLDISVTRVFDMESLPEGIQGIYAPCESDVQTERRIIVYQ